MTVRLGLIFTFDMSVAEWEATGLLDREAALYGRMLASGACREIVWFTYGMSERKPAGRLPAGITVVGKPWFLPTKLGSLIYSVLLPLLRFRKVRRVDVIKTNQMKGAWTAVLAARLHRKPLHVRTGYTWTRLVAVRGKRGIFDHLAFPIERFVYRRADWSSVSSPSQKTEIAEKHGISADRITVLPNAIDTVRFHDAECPRDANRILYVGRLDREKGVLSLIQALAGLPHQLELCYGDAPIEHEARSLAAQQKVNVLFRGLVPNKDLPALMNEAALFVLPSLSENAPKALLEAMACGMCVLGSDVPGINDFIQDGITGVLSGTSPESLRNAITSLMKDPSRMRELGRSARRYVVENLSIEAALSRETDVIRTLTHSRKETHA
jgi:glycosyltransferase involved in cell wall biosynthesis